MSHRYTLEQKAWLTEHIKDYSYAELASAFNVKFNANVSGQNLSDLCIKRMKIHREKNTGLFAVGEERPHMKRIGTEVIREGYVWVKVDDIRHDGTVDYLKHCENWKPKHRLVYEQTHGEIEDGNIIVFIDNNKNNLDTNNLYSVSRKTHATMCANGWYSENPEITLTAIKWCELNRTLRG